MTTFLKKCKWLLFLFFAVTLLQSCISSKSKYLYPKTEQEKLDVDVFMYQAVYNGLISERFPLETAQYVLDHSERFFVPKCPICSPVENAFRDYIKQYSKGKKTKTNKLTLESLQSSDKEIYLLAFKTLVFYYTSVQKMDLELTDSQNKALNKKLEVAKKRGMSGKSDDFGEYCPSCEGACGIQQ